jgi:hypothetical protein
MTAPHEPNQRVLSVDPYLRGFGWALLEGPDLLVDWGIYQTKTNTPGRALARIADLLDRYTPAMLVIEDTEHPGCRRRERARLFISDICDMAKAAGVEVQPVTMQDVRERYKALGAKSKDAVAQVLADRFPELRRIRPPRRKNWMREDERMAVFDALAMTSLSRRELPAS